jgi:hypothetical protein
MEHRRQSQQTSLISKLLIGRLLNLISSSTLLWLPVWRKRRLNHRLLHIRRDGISLPTLYIARRVALRAAGGKKGDHDPDYTCDRETVQKDPAVIDWSSVFVI